MGGRVSHQHFRLEVRLTAIDSIRAFLGGGEEFRISSVLFHEVSQAANLGGVFIEKRVVYGVVFI